MKIKATLTACMGALLGIALCFTACQREEAATEQKGVYKINFTPAKTRSELKALKKDPKANLVRSLVQLDELVATGMTPLAKLPPDALADFRNNLVFNERGIASLKYNQIKRQLTIEEYHQVMAAFGADTRNGFFDGASTNPAARVNGSELATDYICVPNPCMCVRQAGGICFDCC